VQVLSDSADGPDGEGLGPGQELFPGGDPNRRSGRPVDQSLTLEDWVAFDEKVQTRCASSSRASSPCAWAARPRPNRSPRCSASRPRVLDPKLGRQDSAAVFFQHHADDRTAQRAITTAFDEAAPILAPPESRHGVEFAIMAFRPAERDRSAARAGRAAGRERGARRLARRDCHLPREARPDAGDLPHLTSLGREAADHARNEQTAHARFDVTWRAVK